jgi:hypothetical protein
MRQRRHLFVCVQQRGGGGKPACGDRGGRGVLAALQSALAAAPGGEAVAVTGCECLGPCFDGPNVVAYPDAAWWGGAAGREAEITRAALASAPIAGDADGDAEGEPGPG